MPLAIYVPNREDIPQVEEAITRASPVDVAFVYGSGMLNIICNEDEEIAVLQTLERVKILEGLISSL